MSVDFSEISQSIEKNEPSFSNLEKKITTEVIGLEEIVGEWIPKIEAFCERNQLAMSMFCESPQGFWKILEAYGLSSSKPYNKKNS